METPLLAAALIVKNEERNLPGCLEALSGFRPLIGQVCVYDTGSTDRTIELAESFGAKVARGYWDGDFARARNAAIAMCDAKWILIVDADERIEGSVNRLRVTLRNALTAGLTGCDAMSVQVLDVRDSKTELAWGSSRLLRSGRVHYEGRVHEQVVRIKDGVPPIQPEIDDRILRIAHIGYADEARVQEKLARNAEIADRDVALFANDPARVEQLIRSLVDRARSVQSRGDNEAAARDFERARALPSGYTYRWWGMQQLADLYVTLGKFDKAQELADQLRGEGSNPEYCDWIEARALLAQGNTLAGMQRLRRIDKLVSAIGSMSPTALLLETRMSGAILLGEFDEAIASLIPLMARHGQVSGYGKILLRLWGTRPLDLLAEFLRESDGGHLNALVAELDSTAGQGPVLAALLKPHMRPSATV